MGNTFASIDAAPARCLPGHAEESLEPGEHLSNRQVLVAAGTGDIRARVAMDRLAYARRVFQCSLPFCRTFSHVSTRRTQSHGFMTFCRFEWLKDLLPNELPPDCDGDLTGLLQAWQATLSMEATPEASMAQVSASGEDHAGH